MAVENSTTWRTALCGAGSGQTHGALGSDPRYQQLQADALSVGPDTVGDDAELGQLPARLLDNDCSEAARLDALNEIPPNFGKGPPRQGNYIDGGPGRPHYLVAINSGAEPQMGGTIQFIASDGIASLLISFAGSATHLSGTLQTVNIASQGSIEASAVPSSIRVTYTWTMLVVEGCSAFLPLDSPPSKCTFTYSPAVR